MLRHKAHLHFLIIEFVFKKTNENKNCAAFITKTFVSGFKAAILYKKFDLITNQTFF